MKAIVSSKIKVQVSMPGGEVSTTLEGGRTFQGVLQNEELSQLAFRVTEISKGEITFDPIGENLLGRHVDDKKTLEAQLRIIEDLKSKLAELNQAVEKPAKELQDKVTSLSNEVMKLNQEKSELTTNLTQTTDELIKTREQIRSMREKNIPETKPETKPAETA